VEVTPVKTNLLDLEQHIGKLSQLLSEISFRGFKPVTDWLEIAASVQEVKINTIKRKPPRLCGEAMDYGGKRSTLMSQMATRLTIFNFTWGAFETFVKITVPEPPSRINTNSRVNWVCWFLGEETAAEVVEGYEDLVDKLRSLIVGDEYYERYKSAFDTDKLVRPNGVAINVVRKVRNDLAHGSAVMPTPEDWNSRNTRLTSSEQRHLRLVENCTRSILLTMQMVIVERVQEVKRKLEKYDPENGEIQEVTIAEAASRIQLENFRGEIRSG